MHIALLFCMFFMIIFSYLAIGLLVGLVCEDLDVGDFSVSTILLLWPVVILVLMIGGVIRGVLEIITYITDCFDK